MTSTRSQPSPIAGATDAVVGEVRPCPFKASRTCPSCATDLCNGHSKRLSTMGGNLERGRYRRCSACGHEWVCA